MKAILQSNDNATHHVLYMALELSNKKWKLGFSNTERIRVKTIGAGDWPALQQELDLARSKLHCAPDGRVVSCYEAGRDMFWIRPASKSAAANAVLKPIALMWWPCSTC